MNWASNTIRVAGYCSAIREFLDSVRGPDDQLFDFNRIIPMPQLLRHTASGFHKFREEEHRTWYVINPDLPFDDPGYQHNQRPFTAEEKAALGQIGAESWHSWSVENWGTKWNPCHINIGKISKSSVNITFDTAWCAPFPVFQAIAAKFQQLAFEFTWTYEDNPDVTHSMVIRRGEGGAQ